MRAATLWPIPRFQRKAGGWDVPAAGELQSRRLRTWMRRAAGSARPMQTSSRMSAYNCSGVLHGDCSCKPWANAAAFSIGIAAVSRVDPPKISVLCRRMRERLGSDGHEDRLLRSDAAEEAEDCRPRELGGSSSPRTMLSTVSSRAVPVASGPSTAVSRGASIFGHSFLPSANQPLGAARRRLSAGASGPNAGLILVRQRPVRGPEVSGRRAKGATKVVENWVVPPRLAAHH